MLFNKSNTEGQDTEKLKVAVDYFDQIKENYLAEKSNCEFSSDNWSFINFN